MGEIKFSDNFQDLSVHSGTNAGFQFEFYCERCHDKYRSEFSAYKSARASSWLGRAVGMFGGPLGKLESAVEGAAEAGYGVAQAQKHFHRCARCSNYFCDACWNNDKGLCRNCAPDAQVEIEAARASGEVQAAGEKAALEGVNRGKQMDVKRARQLVCPKCGAETKGAKFCPQCGAKLATMASCPKCGAEVSPEAKFCPECGEKIGQG